MKSRQGLCLLLVTFGIRLLLILPSVAQATQTTATGLPIADNQPPKHAALSLQGDKAQAYLQSDPEGQSLMQAVTSARFGLKQQRTPSGEIGSGYLGVSHMQELKAWFAADGVTVSHAGSEKPQDWRMDMRLKAYGYGEQLVPAPPIIARRVIDNRIEYARTNVSSRHSPANPTPELVEWYENQAGGIEQGFTLNKRPIQSSNAKSDEPLRLVLSLSGSLTARVDAAGQQIDLLDERNKRALSYSKLVTVDSAGRELSSHMETAAGGREIVLVVADAGASYPITIDPLLWQQQAKVTGAAFAYEYFGWSVAISGNTAIVGARQDYFQGARQGGTAYAFVRSKGGWKLEQQLSIGLSDIYRRFGESVAISGDTAVIGAIGDDVSNPANVFDQGSAYVFVRSGKVWSQQAKLFAADGVNGDQFGKSVAISGNTIIVGSLGRAGGVSQSPGAAYVFSRTGVAWGQQAQLLNKDAAPGDYFGWSVAISGTTAVVGALGDAGKGSVSVFTRLGSGWPLQQKLAGSSAFDRFGIAVGISGETLVAGVNNVDTSPANLLRQHVDVYARSAGVWSLQQDLKANGGSVSGDGFGTRVAISGNTVVVGAPGRGTSQSANEGAVYIFVRTGIAWEEQTSIAAYDRASGDAFGSSVAISNDTVIAGSATHKVGDKVGQGAAYVYLRSPDTDGDSLPDDWEINGVTIDGVLIDLPAMGANPRHKDLFIHAEWMQPDTTRPPAGSPPGSPPGPPVIFKPGDRAIKMVIDAFAIAPVKNPDLKKGVRLHVDLGPDSIMNPMTGKKWGSLSRIGTISAPFTGVPFQAVLGVAPDGSYTWASVDAIKTQRFTPAKRDAVFHYALFANDYAQAEASSGISSGLPGSDFIVTLGLWDTPGGTPLQQAGTFMHELGHNLNLHHGGDDDIHRKPNYLSNMNYSFQFGLLKANGKQGAFDYSRSKLADLDETNLNENVGIGGPMGLLTIWSKRTHVTLPAGVNKCGQNDYYYQLFFPASALDWDCDGMKNTLPIITGLDINGDGYCVTPGPNNTLESPLLGDDEMRFQVAVAGRDRKCQTVALTANSVPVPGDDVQEAPPGSLQTNVLPGFNDWPALVFVGSGIIGNAAGSGLPAPPSTLYREPSMEAILDAVPALLRDQELVAPQDQTTASPQEGGAPLTVTFDGSASTAVAGTIVDWAWDFGDGTTGSGAGVTHTYNLPGEYYASLTVTDSLGRVNLVPLLTLVTVTNAPTVLFSSPVGGTPRNITFSTSGNVNIASWAWDFGDGRTGSGATVTHKYATGGDYFATLTAIDNTGQVYTVQTLVTVTDVQLPTITIEPQAGGSSETIDFSTSIDGNIVGWAWDFGDGTTGSGSSVTHSYSAPGDYYASLTVTDSNGYTNVAYRRVTVADDSVPTGLNVGDVDPSFKATVTQYVQTTINAIVTQPDGKIIVGGEFESFSGCARRGLARITVQGTCDPTFNPGLVLTELFNTSQTGTQQSRRNLIVQAIVLQPDGKILVGVEGLRGWKDGVSRASKGIFRLNADGTLDASFDANDFIDTYVENGVTQLPAVIVWAIALLPDGRIAIGGSFALPNNVRQYEDVSGTNNGREYDFAILNADGSYDSSFVAVGLPAPLPFQHSAYRAIALQPDGKFILGGTIISVTNGCSAIRLNSDGTRDTTFSDKDPSTGNCVIGVINSILALALQPDGKIVVSGGFRSGELNAFDYPIARLNADGSRDNGFSEPFPAATRGRGLVLQPDGKIILVGLFDVGSPPTSNNVVRLNADGTLDTTYDVGTGTRNPDGQTGPGEVLAVALQSNGKAVIGGSFDYFDNARVEGVVQINPDGSLDDAFDSNGGGSNNEVIALVRQPDGKLLVGFQTQGATKSGRSPRSKINATRLGGLGRLNPDGTTDTTFTSPFDDGSIVQRIALQSDGKIIIHGSFRRIGPVTTPVLRFARLNPDGTIDSTFNPPSFDYFSSAIQPDGKFITSEFYGSAGSQLIRLNVDGSRDDTFSVFLNKGSAEVKAFLPDGHMLITGLFYDSKGNQLRIGRMNPDGSLDATFDPGTGPDEVIRAFILQPDGKILIGGDFFNYNGTPRAALARLNANGSLDTTFVPENPNTYFSDPAYPNRVGALAVQPDGKVFVGSYYRGNVAFSKPNRIFRLNTDGSLDTSFPLAGIEGTQLNVNAIMLQPDNNIIIGGEFDVVKGVERLALARIAGVPGTSNPVDTDNDGVLNSLDTCPLDFDPDQRDFDGDWLGDVCDLDDDGDGIPDMADNCPLTDYPDQSDANGDGVGDVCDGDSDGDGVENVTDSCPLIANPDQEDLDADGIGDACDVDRDGDGLANEFDRCPFDSNPSQADTDGDRVGDACDNCIDKANSNQADSNQNGVGDACEVVEPFCGDGTVGSGEQCDDGNKLGGDGCSASCAVEPFCGDGTVGSGEQCDDGNKLGGDGCSATCAVEPFCGDGTVGSGEQCDDGNKLGGDGCSATCTVEPFCGDGTVGSGEQCDDGNKLGGDGCSATCAVEPFCGDGSVGAGEQCDDGNKLGGDGCSATCTVEPFCGDGSVGAGEQCDDGNKLGGDGCSASCTVENYGGGEGCTPGYWQKSDHFDSWPSPYISKRTLFSAVFDDAFPGKTLFDVLAQSKGSLNALGRQTVSALLNAASPDVNYDLSLTEVIRRFNAAYPGGKSDYQTLEKVFGGYNMQVCPLN